MTLFNPPRAAVVTGAGGFIGRHLSRFLSQNGCDVRGIGYSAMSDEDRMNLGISLWHSGGISSSALKRTSVGAEIIYHCAGSGSVPLSLREPMTDFRSNVLATAEVLEFSREAGGIPVVFMSTAGVYGKANNMPIRIRDPLMPISPYGMNKVAGEQLMRQYGTFFGVPGQSCGCFRSMAKVCASNFCGTRARNYKGVTLSFSVPAMRHVTGFTSRTLSR